MSIYSTIDIMILGIDEAGREPWAGPLAVGTVVLGCQIEGLNDSKKPSKRLLKTHTSQIAKHTL